MSGSGLDILLASVRWEPIAYDGRTPDGLYATHQGRMDIAGVSLKCYVLNDGQRVFDADEVARTFFAITPEPTR